MIHNEEYEIITPDEKSLLEASNSKKKMCNVVNCHGEKTEKCGSKKSILYACPEKGCPRNVESPRQQFFPVLQNLRMHYLSVHNEKKFQCTTCPRRFGNEVVFTHHKKKCKQQVHDCECGRSYTSRNALLTHAKRKQHKIVGVDAEKNTTTGKGTSGVVTVPGILYLTNTQCQTNWKVTHPVTCQANLRNSHPVKSNMVPHDKALLPRLLRILPKAAQSACSVIQKPVIQQEQPVNYKRPLIQHEEPDMQQERSTILEFEERKALSHEKPPEKPTILVENPVLIPENLSTMEENSVVLQTRTRIEQDRSVMQARHAITQNESTPESINSDTQQRDCYKQQLISSIMSVPCTFVNATYKSFNSIISGKRRVKTPKVTKPCKQRKLYGNTSSTKCKDVFNEIGISAKKLAHMCTQTSLSFNDIEESHSPKKVNINTQTQVNADDFHGSPTRTTMDTQTQINYYNCNDVLKKSTMDTQTQIDSCNFDKLPETLNIDTQTQINSNNFNDILKKLTMDTQTEINTYNFNPSLKSTTESMDTQTEINSYNFNDICIKSTVETMDSQTEINYYDFNKSIMDDSQAEINFYKFDDIAIHGNMETQKNKKLNFNEYIAPKKQCDVQTCIGESSTNNLFHLSDNETQTESINPWLSDFTYQELSTMGTQTNLSDNYIQTNFGIEEPLVLDKSIQLDGMISLNETHDIVLTESSNISTQTVEREKDMWLNESLLCESSSTQTDYFENLDFMDVDFNIDSNKNFGGNMTRYCKDTLISGNIAPETKSHMETQTTIPLYDMLDSPLNDNYMDMDKHIASIETQTSDILPEMFYRPTSSIETQTDFF